jgi:hypothetical protein
VTDALEIVRRYSYASVPTIKRFSQSRAFVRGLMGPFGSGKSSGCVIELVKWGKRQHQVNGKRFPLGDQGMVSLKAAMRRLFVLGLHGGGPMSWRPFRHSRGAGRFLIRNKIASSSSGLKGPSNTTLSGKILPMNERVCPTIFFASSIVIACPWRRRQAVAAASPLAQ